MVQLCSASLWRAALLCLCQLLAVMTLGCGNATRSPVEAAGGSAPGTVAGGGSGGGVAPDAPQAGAHEPGAGEPAASLLALEVEPADATLLVDATLSLGVLGVYSNGEKEDVRSRAQLVSSDPQVVSVSSYRLTALAPGVATVTATLFGVAGAAKITVLSKTITAITVTGAPPSFSLGEAQQARAEALMDDGSRQDVTALASWSSSEPRVARLTSTGFLIAMGRGSATLTATVGDVSGSFKQSVTGETLSEYTISGAHVMRLGDRSFLELRAHYGSRVATERDVIWQTSDASVLSLTTNGRLEAVSVGTAKVWAVLGADVPVEVEVVVTGAVLESIELEGKRVFGFCEPPSLRVIGTFSDGASYDVSALLDGGAFDDAVEVVGYGSDTMSVVPQKLGDFELEMAVGDVQTIAQFTILLGAPTSMATQEIGPLPVATSAWLSVRAYCTDAGPSIDVTELVSWSSDDATVADVARVAGVTQVTGHQLGTTNVHATYPGFQIAPLSVSVVAEALTRVPAR